MVKKMMGLRGKERMNFIAINMKRNLARAQKVRQRVLLKSWVWELEKSLSPIASG